MSIYAIAIAIQKPCYINMYALPTCIYAYNVRINDCYYYYPCPYNMCVCVISHIECAYKFRIKRNCTFSSFSIHSMYPSSSAEPFGRV